MEREFVLFASKGFTTPFDLNDLTKGRMDLVARCISAAFFISYAIRKNVIFHVFLNGPSDPPRRISFYGGELVGIEPNEKSIAIKLNECLEIGKELTLGEEIKVGNGIFIAKESFETFLKKMDKKLVYLHPEGVDLRKYKFPEKFIAIIGDHKGLPKQTEKLLDRLNAERISLGKVEYLASHCIVILHNELDRRF